MCLISGQCLIVVLPEIYLSDVVPLVCNPLTFYIFETCLKMIRGVYTHLSGVGYASFFQINTCLLCSVLVTYVLSPPREAHANSTLLRSGRLSHSYSSSARTTFAQRPEPSRKRLIIKYWFKTRSCYDNGNKLTLCQPYVGIHVQYT